MSVPRHPSEHSLSLFAGSDLGIPTRWLVAVHVRKCPRCSSTVAAYREISDELRRELPSPQVDFHALAHLIQVGARAAGTAGGAAQGWRWHWKAVAGAAMGAAALALFLALPFREPEPSTGHHPELAGTHVPLLHEGIETRVTARGRLSVRAFHDGSGTLTVTEYYAP